MAEIVSQLAEDGILVVTAAGNHDKDACNSSPAHTGGTGGPAISVGATNVTDEMAFFSNYGTCVDVLAPGFDVRSAFFISDSASFVASGTSFAAPHVAGVVARLMAGIGIEEPAALKALVLATALRDKIQIPAAKGTTPNLLAQAPRCLWRCF